MRKLFLNAELHVSDLASDKTSGSDDEGQQRATEISHCCSSRRSVFGFLENVLIALVTCSRHFHAACLIARLIERQRSGSTSPVSSLGKSLTRGLYLTQWSLMEATATYVRRGTVAANDDNHCLGEEGTYCHLSGTYCRRTGALWDACEGNLEARHRNDYSELIRKIFETFEKYYSIRLTNRIG